MREYDVYKILESRLTIFKNIVIQTWTNQETLGPASKDAPLSVALAALHQFPSRVESARVDQEQSKTSVRRFESNNRP